MTCRAPQFSLDRRRMSVRCRRGFTLIEVAVASAVLAISLMGILMICSTGIRTAKILDRVHVDAATLAAELSLTNRLEDGSSEDGDFGDFHPGYRWHREINQVQTNGLFQVDFTVWSGAGPGHDESHLSILLFRPESIPRVGGLR